MRLPLTASTLTAIIRAHLTKRSLWRSEVAEIEQKNGMSLVVNVTPGLGHRPGKSAAGLPAGGSPALSPADHRQDGDPGPPHPGDVPWRQAAAGAGEFYPLPGPGISSARRPGVLGSSGAAAGGPGAAGRQPVCHRRRQCLCGTAGLLQHGLCDENVSRPPGGTGSSRTLTRCPSGLW